MTVNPEHYAEFITAVITKVSWKQDTLSDERRDPRTTSKSWADLSNGIANISQRQRGDVISVAFNKDPKQETIELIVSNNMTVEEPTLKFLKDLWPKLWAISADEPRDTNKVEALRKFVYSHTFDKVKRRVGKRIASLQKLITDIDINPQSRTETSNLGQLKFFLSDMESILDISTEEPDISKVIEIIDRIWQQKYNEDQIQRWLEAVCVKKNYEDKWLFRRYLSKVKSVHKSLEGILDAIMDPEVRTFLRKNLKLKSLEEENVPLEFGDDVDSLLQLFKNGDLDYFDTGTCNLPIAIQKLIKDKHWRVVKVHSESKIVSLIAGEKNPGDKEHYRHIEYIGISKLACPFCHAYIKSFSDIVRTLEVLGAHAKAYPVGLLASNTQLMRDLRKAMMGHLHAYWTNRIAMIGTSLKPRGLSESTTGSDQEKPDLKFEEVHDEN